MNVANISLVFELSQTVALKYLSIFGVSQIGIKSDHVGNRDQNSRDIDGIRDKNRDKKISDFFHTF